MEIHDEDNREDPENYRFKDWQDKDDADADENDKATSSQRQMTQCPHCGKWILEVAPKCHHCKNWVVEKETPRETTSHKRWVRITAWIMIAITLIGLAVFGFWFWNDYGFHLR